MFAFFPIRFAVIRDCFSLVSTMIGTLGLGHLIPSDFVFTFEKMFSICFFIIMFVAFLFRRSLFLSRRLLDAFFFLCDRRRNGKFHQGFF